MGAKRDIYFLCKEAIVLVDRYAARLEKAVETLKIDLLRTQRMLKRDGVGHGREVGIIEERIEARESAIAAARRTTDLLRRSQEKLRRVASDDPDAAERIEGLLNAICDRAARVVALDANLFEVSARAVQNEVDVVNVRRMSAETIVRSPSSLRALPVSTRTISSLPPPQTTVTSVVPLHEHPATAANNFRFCPNCGVRLGA